MKKGQSSPQGHHLEEDSTNNSNSIIINKAETVGEELYLVHLRRHEGEEVRPEDFDHSEGINNNDSTTSNKKRSSSIGEELWNVHMKRSRGMEPDTDTDNNTGNEEDEDHHEEGIKDQEAIPSPSRYNLRTRRGKKTVSQ